MRTSTYATITKERKKIQKQHRCGGNIFSFSFDSSSALHSTHALVQNVRQQSKVTSQQSGTWDGAWGVGKSSDSLVEEITVNKCTTEELTNEHGT